MAFEFGRLDLIVPGTDLHVGIVVSGEGREDINPILEYYQSFRGCDKRIGEGANAREENSQGVVWYMEKKYSDRRLLMDVHGYSRSCMETRCWCELDTGVSLFAVYPAGDIEDLNCEWLWRLFRSIKVEIKCRDAFNCLRTEASAISHIPATRKLQWNDVNPDIGAFEWRSFRQFRVFLPSNVSVECCCIDEEDFVFDLPDKCHYVTAYGIDMEDSKIEKKLGTTANCRKRRSIDLRFLRYEGLTAVA